MLPTFAVLSLWLVVANPVSPTQSEVVSLPQGEVTRIPSPDAEWILLFECPNNCAQRKLWVEGRNPKSRRLIKNYQRSLDVSWAPDSKHFFVNDVWGSNGADCSVYEPANGPATDIANMLIAADPEVKRFLRAGHSYVRAKEWVNARELIVVLFGHFDDPSLSAFTIRYRVNLDGKVHKLSKKNFEENW